jgi:predicted molibdopterin-dependent oxidoreductase YjgC
MSSPADCAGCWWPAPTRRRNAADRRALRGLSALIVCELFLTETAKLAHVALPAQAFAEREGTYTGGDRRVQRFCPALRAPRERARLADLHRSAARLGTTLPSASAAAVMARITQDVPQYAG